jgi:hypothetical protein
MIAEASTAEVAVVAALRRALTASSFWLGPFG